MDLCSSLVDIGPSHALLPLDVGVDYTEQDAYIDDFIGYTFSLDPSSLENLGATPISHNAQLREQVQYMLHHNAATSEFPEEIRARATGTSVP